MKGFKQLDLYENVYLEEQSDRLFRMYNGQMVPFLKMEIIQEQMSTTISHKQHELLIFDYVNSEAFNLVKFSVACLHKLDYSLDEVLKIMFKKYETVNDFHKNHLSKQVFAMGISSFYKAMDRMTKERFERN